MGNIFEQDFEDFLKALDQNDVDFLLVGGYAVILHGYFRSTADLDLWIKPTLSNYNKMIDAFLDFGLPSSAISKADFLDNDEVDVFTFGRPPISIDIMTSVKGLSFEESCQSPLLYIINESLTIPVINYNHLIQAKKAAGRLKDLNDIEHLVGE